ncbi:MAG TPA: transposase [Vicinamibacterales bacterium]|nr:transposase [Vicinamibacterales bacterium]
MARPLRIQQPDTIYHVMARGNARMRVFCDDDEHARFLDQLGDVLADYCLACHSYCLMPNHYHLLVETTEPNLSDAMRALNGEYAQWWNRRHARVGHVWQGRFKAQVLQDPASVLAVCRYIVLNPVRSRLVDRPSDWPWSSHRAMSGECRGLAFLIVDRIRQQLGGSRAYQAFVGELVDVDDVVGRSIRDDLRVIGDREFTAGFRVFGEQADRTEVPERDRLLGRRLLAEVLRAPDPGEERDRQILHAHRAERYRLCEIADFLGVHYSTISRAVARAASDGDAGHRRRVRHCKT